MPIASAVAIYFLFWVMSLFVVLPFGVRTTEEAGGEKIPGQAESAPNQPQFRRIALRTTIVSAALCGRVMLNVAFGWITPEMLDWTPW